MRQPILVRWDGRIYRVVIRYESLPRSWFPFTELLPTVLGEPVHVHFLNPPARLTEAFETRAAVGMTVAHGDRVGDRSRALDFDAEWLELVFSEIVERTLDAFECALGFADVDVDGHRRCGLLLNSLWRGPFLGHGQLCQPPERAM